MEQAVDKKRTKTLSNYLRVVFKRVLDAGGKFLTRLGLKPNQVSLIGFVGNIVGAALLATGHIFWGGVLVLLMGLTDVLDGTMARLQNRVTRFGGFLDSVLDRYSELFIFGGLLIYYIQRQDWLACGLIYLSAAGSVLVSYVKARAQSLNYEADVGILTRFERYVVLAPALLFNRPIIGLWIIAILANFTAIQRIYHVSRQVSPEKPEE